MFRFFTGDEVGLVKDIRLGVSQRDSVSEDNNTSKLSIKSKDQLEHEQGAKTPTIDSQGSSKSESLASVIGGTMIDREKRVDCMCSLIGSQTGRRQIVTACKDGVVRVYGTDHNQSILVNEVKLFTPAIDELTGKPVLNKRKESEHFIGIHCTNDDKLIAATDSGKFWVVSNISSSSPSVPIISTSGSLGMDNLCVMRVHSAQSNLFITGGMERDLMLWDLEKIGSESSGLVENEQQTQQEVDVSATPLVQLTPVWKAKNVPHDALDLRQPIWITEMQFIDPFGNPSKIVVGTGYHQVRVYDMRLTSVIHQGSGATIYSVEDENQEDSVNNNDNADIPIITKSQRKKMARAKHDQMNLNRPLFSVEIGEHPIKCISVCPNNPSLIVVSDSVGLLSKFNLDSKKIVCAYKGCTGAVSAIQVFNTAINNKAGSDTDDHEDDEEEATGMDMVVAVGLDRFLRVWELDSSKLFNKLYIKQRTSSVLVDTTWCHDFAISGGDINPMTGQKRRSKEDLEEETLWRGMKVVRGA